MTTLLIISSQTGAAGMTADIIVIAGDYAGTPVKALHKASLAFQKPVVLIAGLMELDGTVPATG